MMKLRVLGLVLLMITMLVNGNEGKQSMSTVSQLAVSVVIDAKGRLWRVGVNNGFVMVSMSKDLGKTFSPPIQVNPTKQKIPAYGERRPKIAIGSKGEVYVTWMQYLSQSFSSYIWFSRSIDEGKSFHNPITVHQDRSAIGHAFEEINVAADGTITVVWLGTRDLVSDKKSRQKQHGSSVYYATSIDGGGSFTLERKLTNDACECCSIATTMNPDGTVAVMWRHTFSENDRDHMMAEIPNAGAPPKLKRATFEHWEKDDCAHHDGTLAAAGEGVNWWGYYMAYFDGNDNKPGLYYSRMDGNAWVASPAKQFGDNAKQARHPALLSIGDVVWLAWLETSVDKLHKVMGMKSIDEGKTWTDPSTFLSVAGKAGYPQLLQHEGTVYLVMNTAEGLKVSAI